MTASFSDGSLTDLAIACERQTKNSRDITPAKPAAASLFTRFTAAHTCSNLTRPSVSVRWPGVRWISLHPTF